MPAFLVGGVRGAGPPVGAPGEPAQFLGSFGREPVFQIDFGRGQIRGNPGPVRCRPDEPLVKLLEDAVVFRLGELTLVRGDDVGRVVQAGRFFEEKDRCRGAWPFLRAGETEDGTVPKARSYPLLGRTIARPAGGEGPLDFCNRRRQSLGIAAEIKIPKDLHCNLQRRKDSKVATPQLLYSEPSPAGRLSHRQEHTVRGVHRSPERMEATIRRPEPVLTRDGPAASAPTEFVERPA